MLVFVDESGDTGRKIGLGSSRYFIIALVIFEENDEAVSCDQRITLLKRELRVEPAFEFKFSQLRKDLRIKFYEAVLPYSFFYFGIVIDKDLSKLWGEGFNVKESFYKYACSLVFENAKPYLKDAIVVFDGSGTREFKRQLRLYLRRKLDSGIRKVKIQSSHSNNLIQLADMVVGAINRSFTNKNDKTVYRNMIRIREMYVQTWPEEK